MAQITIPVDAATGPSGNLYPLVDNLRKLQEAVVINRFA